MVYNSTNATLGDELIKDAPVFAYVVLSFCVLILVVIWFKPLFVVCCRKKTGKAEHRAQVRFVGDECILCLEPIINMVEISCGHAFCAKCMSEYWRNRTGAALLCPICRRVFTCIFKNYENDSQQPPNEVNSSIDEYNTLFGGEQKSFCQILKDFPMVMKTYFRSCCSAGMACKSCCLLSVILLTIVYIISPYDLFPESVFGIFGYIDDVSVLVYVIFIIGKIMLSVIFRERDNEQQ